MTDRLTFKQLNELDRDAFVQRLGGIFEHSPWVAEAAWPRRPFSSVEALHRAMVAEVAAADRARQLELLRAHPELAGAAADSGSLTPDSASEQRRVGLHVLSDEQLARVRQLNARYTERFGFPFIIAVRNHDLPGLLEQWQKRLRRTPEVEHETALAEVAKIARFRLDDLIGEGS